VNPIGELLLNFLHSSSYNIFTIVNHHIFTQLQSLSMLLQLFPHFLFIAQGELIVFLSQLGLYLLTFLFPALSDHKHVLLHLAYYLLVLLLFWTFFLPLPWFMFQLPFFFNQLFSQFCNLLLIICFLFIQSSNLGFELMIVSFNSIELLLERLDLVSNIIGQPLELLYFSPVVSMNLFLFFFLLCSELLPFSLNIL